MIEFDHVSKIYNGNKVAVEDVNLSFNKGEFICLIGTSGSGKTTTMRMINRMIDPTRERFESTGRISKRKIPLNYDAKLAMLFKILV